MGEAKRKARQMGAMSELVKTDTLASFQQALKTVSAQKLIFQRSGEYRYAPLGEDYHSHDWDVPAFDFQELLSGDGEDSLGQTTIDAFFKASSDEFMEDRFHLPFPECIFIFRTPDRIDRHGGCNLVYVVEDESAFTGITFSKQPGAPRPHNAWTRSPCQFTLVDRGVDFAWDEVELDEASRASIKADIRSKYTELLVGCAMMRSKGVASRVDEDAARVCLNIEREQAGKRKLEGARLIRFDRERYSPPGGERPDILAKAKRPHERRGHWRHLKRTDRNVWIRHSQIHGGSAIAPSYVIET